MASSEEQIATWKSNPKTETLLAIAEEKRLSELKALVNENTALAMPIVQSLALDDEQRKSLVESLTSEELTRIIKETVPQKPKWRWKFPDKLKLKWRTLRAIGGNRLFKVSYIAIVLIPFFSQIIQFLETNFVNQFNTNKYFLAALYFGSLFFAIGNLFYDVFCPNIIKRFESANDLYNKMLSIRAKQRINYPNDDFDGSYKHSIKAFTKYNGSKWLISYLTGLFYLVGIILLAYVLIERSIIVVINLLEKDWQSIVG